MASASVETTTEIRLGPKEPSGVEKAALIRMLEEKTTERKSIPIVVGGRVMRNRRLVSKFVKKKTFSKRKPETPVENPESSSPGSHERPWIPGDEWRELKKRNRQWFKEYMQANPNWASSESGRLKMREEFEKFRSQTALSSEVPRRSVETDGLSTTSTSPGKSDADNQFWDPSMDEGHIPACPPSMKLAMDENYRLASMKKTVNDLNASVSNGAYEKEANKIEHSRSPSVRHDRRRDDKSSHRSEKHSGSSPEWQSSRSRSDRWKNDAAQSAGRDRSRPGRSSSPKQRRARNDSDERRHRRQSKRENDDKRTERRSDSEQKDRLKNRSDQSRDTGRQKDERRMSPKGTSNVNEGPAENGVKKTASKSSRWDVRPNSKSKENQGSKADAVHQSTDSIEEKKRRSPLKGKCQRRNSEELHKLKSPPPKSPKISDDRPESSPSVTSSLANEDRRKSPTSSRANNVKPRSPSPYRRENSDSDSPGFKEIFNNPRIDRCSPHRNSRLRSPVRRPAGWHASNLTPILAGGRGLKRDTTGIVWDWSIDRVFQERREMQVEQEEKVKEAKRSELDVVGRMQDKKRKMAFIFGEKMEAKKEEKSVDAKHPHRDLPIYDEDEFEGVETMNIELS